MKKTFLLIAALMLCSIAGYSQQEKSFRSKRTPKASAEELMKEKWNFIVDQTSMKEEVANKIFPLFESYEKQLLESQKRKQDLHRELRTKSTIEEKDYKAANDLTLKFETEKADAFSKYYKELDKLLTDKELYNYLRAERSFKRELFGPRQGWKGPQPPTGRPEMCPRN